MKKLTKLFSLLTVLLTMFGPLGNLRHLVHANDAQETKVFVHKILLNKNEFEAFNHEEKKAGYNGNQIGTITDYFGSSAKDIGGVTFKVYKQVADSENGEGVVTGNSLLGLEDSNPNSDTKKYKLHTETSKASITTVENQGAEVVLENGTYIFVEDKENSPYYNKQGDGAGSELTEAKAVPFKLELPVTKPDGLGYFDTTTPLHVYPKNTEDKPTVTKEFKTGGTETKNVAIGEEIEYKIDTTIPKGSSYKTIVWEDLMVEGLDFVENSIQVSSQDLTQSLVATTDYEVTQSKRGFTLKVKETGLAKIEASAKDKNINITITYKGVLNDSAKVDTQIPNKVTFHYGNRPRTFTDTEPEPVTPKEEDGIVKIKVNKVWKNLNDKKAVKFKVYEKNTGALAGEFTLETTEESKEFSTNLKSGVEYIVVEDTPSGTIPSYTSEGGEKAHIVTVTNNPSDNPPPIVPEQPKVITYGKRFIKTDNKETLEGSEKLLGAEFVVLNAEQNKYLALKTSDTKEKEVQDYNRAEQAYLTALKTGAADAEKATRDAAYETLNMQWEWVTDESQAFKFISSTEGKFEVKGLKEGTYYLKETKAPEGYALPSDKIPFQVSRGSWGEGEEVTTNNFQQVKNKKVTIPQTGGIGTLVFTVVGLSVMAFAFIAMKKRQTEDA
ncbi:TPA: SpaH/EbpB family LPXTG-anchored major pilin [Streptococcus suis]|nr:SpaH/EbpB family LPXTG-anchored major pilin [Streptococcus suis]